MDPQAAGLDERTWYCDRLYGVVGRALAYAQSFEGECKSLHALLECKSLRAFPEVKNNPESSYEDTIAALVEKLYRQPLGPHVGYLTKLTGKAMAESFDEASANGLSDYFAAKLKEAKEARNAIAHEMALWIRNSMTDQDVEHFIEHMKTLLGTIIEAYVLVFNIARSVTEEDTLKAGQQYHETVIDWVCSIEDD